MYKEKIKNNIIIVLLSLFALLFIGYNIGNISQKILAKNVDKAYMQYNETKDIKYSNELIDLLDSENIKYIVTNNQIITDFFSYSNINGYTSFKQNKLSKLFSIYNDKSTNAPDYIIYTDNNKSIVQSQYKDTLIIGDNMLYYNSSFFTFMLCLIIEIICPLFLLIAFIINTQELITNIIGNNLYKTKKL